MELMHLFKKYIIQNYVKKPMDANRFSFNNFQSAYQ